MNREEKKYRDWLIEICVPNHKDRESYRFLLERIWDKEFYSLVDNDSQREKDGVELRNDYPSNKIQLALGPARCLEVLIGISKRCAYETYNPSGDPYPWRYFFWEFLKNLDLIYFTKRNWVNDDIFFEVDARIEAWIERRYEVDGSGGIFPLEHAEEDQRTVELWYQMQAYLLERYI